MISLLSFFLVLGVRLLYQELLLSSYFQFDDARLLFAKVFGKLHPKLFDKYIYSDIDHTDSCTSMTVQLYTMPTVVGWFYSLTNL